jgi:outer membrane protein TolC
MLAPMPPASQLVRDWNEAMGLLRAHSTDLRTSQANVARAEGRWRQALSAILPNARLTVSVIHDVLNPDVPALGMAGSGASSTTVNARGRVPTAPLGAASATLSQSLIDVGAWQGVSSASASTHQAENSLQDLQRTLTLGLARSLVATVAAERVAELNRLGLRLALERGALTQRTFELGAATQLDVVRVDQDVEVSRGSLIAGDEQLRRTREALGLALGLPKDIGVAPGFQMNGLLEQIRAECRPIDDLEARADIAAAREQEKSARRARRQAVAGYFPTLGLNSSAFAYTTDPGIGRLSTWSIAAVLSVPLWEGGLREGLVKERSGTETQAALALERARREAQVDTGRSRRGVQVAQTLLDSASKARALADRTDQLTRRSFEVGKSSSLELVQSASALRQAELALAVREFELVQARLEAFLTEALCDF